MSSSKYPKLELKYCERCGGLWLRPQGGEAVYCARCQETIAELPAVRTRGNGPAGAIQAAYVSVVAFLFAFIGFAGEIGGVAA